MAPDRADVYLAGTDPMHTWGLARRRVIQVGTLPVSLAPPEYVIVRKLQYAAMGGGDRHLRDIHRMLARRLVPLDLEALEQHVQTLGVQGMWARALAWREPV